MWATADALTKRFFSDLNPYEMGMIRLLYLLPFLIPLLFIVSIPPLGAAFWAIVALLLPVEGAALFLYMNSIQSSPLSLTLPFLSFTPAFLILTGFLFLGELPNLWGAGGIILVVAGTYILNLNKKAEGAWGPFRAVLAERGSWMMLLVSLLYAYTSALGKAAILRSDPLFFGPFYIIALTLFLLPFLLLTKRVRIAALWRRPWQGMAVGGAAAVMLVSHYFAITMVQAAYMIAVKRLSPLFGVLYGGILFGEEEIGVRLAGVGMMISGVFLITLLG